MDTGGDGVDAAFGDVEAELVAASAVVISFFGVVVVIVVDDARGVAVGVVIFAVVSVLLPANLVVIVIPEENTELGGEKWLDEEAGASVGS